MSEQLLHLAHSLLDPDDNGASDNTMADVELDDLRNGNDRCNIFVIEAVAAVNFQTQTVGKRRRSGNGISLLFPFRSNRITIGSGVDFHCVSANRLAGLDLILSGVDEEAYVDSSILKAFNGLEDFLFVRQNI